METLRGGTTSHRSIVATSLIDRRDPTRRLKPPSAGSCKGFSVRGRRGCHGFDVHVLTRGTQVIFIPPAQVIVMAIASRFRTPIAPPICAIAKNLCKRVCSLPELSGL
jgi:hypothetical protein